MRTLPTARASTSWPGTRCAKASFGTEAEKWSAQVVGPDSSFVSNALAFQVAAPVPQIDEIRPARTVAGGLGFDLAVYGRTLTEDSQIRWNGESYPTTPIYSSENAAALTIGLKAQIPASAIASAGEQRVTVHTPPPGGGVSAPRMLRVAARPLYLTPWFYLLCIAGIVLAGAVLHGLRIRHMREKVLEKKVEQRTEQLRREKKKTEEQAERLRELDAAKSRFFANLSHEFRTPLTLILGPLRDLLRKEEALSGSAPRLDPEEKRQIAGAARSARRLQDLIGQLLTLARLEAGQMPLHRRRLDLVEEAREVVRSFQPWAERERVTLRFNAAAEWLAVDADAEKLRRVVSNLLSNALKFTPAGGTVSVSVSAAGDEVLLRVRDTGCGIPAGELRRVFDRFHQVSGAGGRKHGGTGIGLALAKELVELHSGRIEAESEEGFGSAFTVTLPAAREKTGSEAAEEDGGDEERARGRRRTVSAGALLPDTSADGEPLDLADDALGDAADSTDDAPTVLVVEDNADVRAYVRSHLAADYRVEEARDGAEALDAIRAARPDLVVSDVMMPQVSGTELVRRIRDDEALADLPVILLTARAGEAERIEGLCTGADDYIEKPFSAEELKARVRNLIRSRAGLRERYGRTVVMQPSGVSVTPEDEALYEEARAVVEAHMSDPGFGVSLFAAEMGEAIQSKSQLTRRLKEATGMTPGEFVRRMRMECAAQLLEKDGRLRVYEVAGKVGYRDAEVFSRRFRKHFGVPPSQYPPEDEA